MANVGNIAIMGMSKESSYRTAVDATDKIPFNSESIEAQPEVVDDESLQGVAGFKNSQKVFTPVGGSFDAGIVYSQKSGSEYVSSDLPIALAMGDGGTYANSSNYFLLEDDLDVFGTVAVLKGTSDVWENVSCYINSMSLAMDNKSGLKGSFDIIGYKQLRTGTTNVAADLTGLPSDVANQILSSDLTCYAGDTTNALTAADKKMVSSATLSLSNNMSDSEQATPENSGHTDSDLTIEPVRNGFREVTLELTIPRYDSDTWLAYRDNQTELQVEFAFTDGTHEFFIAVPSFKIQTVSAPVGGSGLITQTVSGKCFVPSHTITKFDNNSSVTVTTEFGIETKNERTSALW